MQAPKPSTKAIWVLHADTTIITIAAVTHLQGPGSSLHATSTRLKVQSNFIGIWDLIGLSEVLRKGEDLLRLTSGHLFFFRGHEDTSYGGVGFLINKTTTMATMVQNIKGIPTRVFIQIYAPTSKSTEDEIEAIYEDIEKALADTP
ncbi:Endonuclease-reverse transcriptase, partial [Operophtera brumata]